jgi:Uncharacterized protein conserved in bacteria (DUF2219)
MSLTASAAKVAFWLLCAASCAMHAANARGEALTVTGENDVLTNSDNNYTNGGAISWVSSDLDTYDSDSFVSKWASFWKFLPFVDDDGYKTYEAWSLVQEMNTPDDIQDPNPPEDDQPYAGVLYVDSLLYARKERWAHVWQLRVGVVGPASQAEEVQNKVHDLIGSDEALGWDTQLPNEPVINIGYTGLISRRRDTWAGRPNGESSPWEPWASATTSPASARASTGKSAGISWTPSRAPRCVAGSMPHRRLVSDRSIAGRFHSSAAWRSTVSFIICRSTAQCFTTVAL